MGSRASDASTLSSVVSSLVRASMGASVPDNVTDEDLDKHVAELILKEAKQREERYNGKEGIRAYLPDTGLPENLPKPNKRFLNAIIRSVGDHNTAVIEAQTRVAQEARETAEAEARRLKRARADEAAGERLRRLMGGTRLKAGREPAYGNGKDARPSRNRDSEPSPLRRPHSPETVLARSKDGGHPTLPHTREDIPFARGLSSTGSEDTPEGYGSNKPGPSSPGPPPSRSEEHSRRTKGSDDRYGEEEESGSRGERRRHDSVNDHSSHPRNEIHHNKRSKDEDRSSRSRRPEERDSRKDRAPRSRSRERRKRHSRSRSKDRSRPSKRRHRSRSNSVVQDSKRARRRTISPDSRQQHAQPPSPSSRLLSPPTEAHMTRSSKMDKYFDADYDPLLDTGPQSNDPLNDIIPEGAFVEWDKMLVAMQERRAYKEERKRSGKDEKKKTKKHKGGRDREEEEEEARQRRIALGLEKPSALDIKYVKRGSTREWDVGKNTS